MYLVNSSIDYHFRVIFWLSQCVKYHLIIVFPLITLSNFYGCLTVSQRLKLLNYGLTSLQTKIPEILFVYQYLSWPCIGLAWALQKPGTGPLQIHLFCTEDSLTQLLFPLYIYHIPDTVYIHYTLKLHLHTV